MISNNINFGPNDRISNIQSDRNYNFHAKLKTQNDDEIIDPFENIEIQCKYSILMKQLAK